MNTHRQIVVTFALSLGLFSVASAQDDEPSTPSWTSPAPYLATPGGAGDLAWPEERPEARPGAYWWWPDSAVTEADLTWNMETYREAGFGNLGTIGIYGVISYIVSQRTRELGVRLALGANAGDVRKMVLKQGMILCAFGVLFGLGAAIGLTRLMGALLYGVEPVDPATFGVVSISLTLVALVASYVPAARAAGIDPVQAIRNEV